MDSSSSKFKRTVLQGSLAGMPTKCLAIGKSGGNVGERGRVKEWESEHGTPPRHDQRAATSCLLFVICFCAVLLCALCVFHIKQKSAESTAGGTAFEL